jgi:hypothetical protein
MCFEEHVRQTHPHTFHNHFALSNIILSPVLGRGRFISLLCTKPDEFT